MATKLFCAFFGVASAQLAAADTLPNLIPGAQTIIDPFCARVTPLPLLVVNPTFSIYVDGKNDSFRLSDVTHADEATKIFVDGGYFKQGRQVVFVIHGYFGNYACPVWMYDVKDGVLKADDSTVIIVTWYFGADIADYGVSAATTQTVAQAVAAVAEAIARSSVFQDNPDNIHIYCIGASLGAHTCGQAGRLAKNAAGVQLFDRVTGLDPAGPGFETCTDHLNIDKDSAACVDNIHTDGSVVGHVIPLYLGTLKQWGHIDFYPNGGYNQPSCKNSADANFVCNHLTAVEYFILSLRTADACESIGACSEVSNLPGSCAKKTQNLGYYSSCYKATPGALQGIYYTDVSAGGGNPKCVIPGFSYCMSLNGVTVV